MTLVKSLAEIDSTSTNAATMVDANTALAPAVPVELQPAIADPTPAIVAPNRKPKVERVVLPTPEEMKKPTPALRRANWKPRTTEYRPGAPVPLEFKMIGLRRTYGQGLASGQILIRTPKQRWKFEENPELFVSAVFLPGAEDRVKPGVVQDHISWMPYDETGANPRDQWDILEIKVTETGRVLVRACTSQGKPYKVDKEGRHTYYDMDFKHEYVNKSQPWRPFNASLKLSVYKPEHISAIKEFTGLEFPVWQHGGRYGNPALDEVVGSAYAQRQSLQGAELA